MAVLCENVDALQLAMATGAAEHLAVPGQAPAKALPALGGGLVQLPYGGADRPARRKVLSPFRPALLPLGPVVAG